MSLCPDNPSKALGYNDENRFLEGRTPTQSRWNRLPETYSMSLAPVSTSVLYHNFSLMCLSLIRLQDSVGEAFFYLSLDLLGL